MNQLEIKKVNQLIEYMMSVPSTDINLSRWNHVISELRRIG